MTDKFDLFKTDQQNNEQGKLSAQRDLEIGRQIQASFLPKKLPQPAGWEIRAQFEAARQVAGDFYDAFSISGGKRIGLVVGDICDKGVGAALFMALFRSLIRAFAEQHYSLGWMDVLSGDAASGEHGDSVARRRNMLSTGTTALKNAIDLTNAYIYRNHGDTSMFATIFFGVLDPTNGSLVYINGGHVPPLVIGAQGIKARLEPTGPAVGLLPDLKFGIEQVDLDPGDTLLVYTDGVTDALSPKDEFFSEERLFSLVEQPSRSAEDLLRSIQINLHNHIAGADQFDDITLLAARRNFP
jgi:sigma-B regulation protein RsbU (phosphoserine phosphatase)